jgi:drug/metabolite transporter (DMT)-like permease
MRFIGSILVMIAAVGFGFMGLFGSWATDAGVSVEMMLFLRFAIAGAIMVVLMLVRGERWPRGKLLIWLIGMGAVLYVGEAMFWFHAARFIPAGLVSLLLYIYPVIVTLYSALFLHERLTPARLLAVGLAVGGLGLTIGPIAFAQFNQVGSNPDAWIGITLGLLCCLSYSIYILVGGPATKRAGPIPASTVVILSAAVVLGAISLGRGDALPHVPQAWLGIVGLALFSTVIAITAVLIGLTQIGPVQTSTLSTLEPVTTVIVGAALMGQTLSVLQIVGGALIVVAAVIVARSAAVKNVEVLEIH